MPVTVPLDQIPLIRCGPMLRRVEADSVSVFIALKHARHVTLTVYEGDTTAAPVAFQGHAQTVALNAALAACERADPLPPLTLGLASILA